MYFGGINLNNYTGIKYLYTEEKERLFTILCKSKDKHALRNKSMFFLAEYCALRASEVGLLTTDLFNPDTREIYCRRLKNGRNNTLRIIDDTVYYSLIEYLNIKDSIYTPSPYLFPSNRGNPISRKMIDVLMKKYCNEAKISEDKSHFHVLRHTRAIELAEHGLGIREIQYWLGHSDIKNTEIYLQFTSKQYDNLYQKLLEH